ncbi:MAG: hypothetical protein KA004_02240 [Verrucomicrobiales bacterium]|nr:hypothetical protein [Verrucomicrobiales bacterium]
MSTDPSPPPILYCRCAFAQVVPEDTKRAVLEGLCESGVPFTAVPDLCEMSARRDPRLTELAQTSGLRIAACHRRAVQWLFHAAGAPLPDSVEVVNMRELSAADSMSALLQPPAESPATSGT